MSAVIDQDLDGQSGRGESRESGVSTDLELWNALHAELADVRAKYAALLAKLDGEGGLGGGYVSTCALADPQLLKGE